MGVGNGVSVGKFNAGAGFTSNEKRDGWVGVDSEGWNGVGVGGGKYSDVTRMNGCGGFAGVGATGIHADKRIEITASREEYLGGFIYIYGVGVGNAVGLAVRVGTGVAVGAGVGVDGTGVLLGATVAVNGRAVSVSGSVGCGVLVVPGRGDGVGVRVGTFGTQRISPA